METITIENVDKKQANLFKELALQMGLKATSVSIKKKVKGNKQKDTGIINNPEILKRIKDLESRKSKFITFKDFTKAALKLKANG